MHGLGNNYIYVNMFTERIAEEKLPELAKTVSNVNTGIGSDGLILITPSSIADVGMRIFNKDGSEGMNCGNGLRCVAKYAYDYQLVVNKTSFFIEAKSGVVHAEVHVENGKVSDITIDMGEPRLEREKIPMTGNEGERIINEPFVIDEAQLNITAVSMGNPHAVFFVNNIEDAPLHRLGPIITDDYRFPEGVNVEFVEVVSKHELNFRVWERGSGITEACGTGACAAVVASILNGFSDIGEEVCVHLSGGDLYITWNKDGRVSMRGPAQTVVTGTFHWE
ncbi:diaminopimelate epimerase [Salirhabdus salicampi]|nr:diaminopimelate epimerase [Salirhabdus salicampi]